MDEDGKTPVQCEIWNNGTYYYPVIAGVSYAYMKRTKVYQVIDKMRDEGFDEVDWTDKFQEFVS